MDIHFERGDPQKPKGHALACFRTSSEPDKVYATYIIVLPISVDFAKYVPPFLASHIGNMPLNDLSAFSLPPVPEEVGSYEEVQRLADMRNDDLLDTGATMYNFDLPEMMEAVGEVVRHYTNLWSDYYANTIPSSEEEAARKEDDPSSGVNEVLYSFMSEHDRLAELSKLVGKLRFAVEGNDQQTGEEMREEINTLGKYLPDGFYIPNLLQAVMDSSARGAQLAQLYLDRCYKLSNGDATSARALEEKIEVIKASGAS